MSTDAVEDRTIDIVAEIFNEDQAAVDRSTDFVSELHAKSMDIIALVAALEDEFGISISVAEVQDNSTVGEAIDWIEANVEDE